MNFVTFRKKLILLKEYVGNIAAEHKQIQDSLSAHRCSVKTVYENRRD